MNPKFFEDLIAGLPDGEVRDVRIGLHWTAVVAWVEGELRCGLASTQKPGGHSHDEPNVPQAGDLQGCSGRELVDLFYSDQPVLTSVGMAALNALLPRTPEKWIDANAEETLAQRGRGRQVALIGHFPFVPRLREKVGELTVLELDPREGDMPAEAAAQVLPKVDIVAITSMTLVNRTLPDLLKFCSAQAFVMLLGPTTPLSPRLFEHGIDWLSGSVVTEIEPVLRVVSQGGNFRQVHRAGVRLVNLKREDFE
ncbi:MAG: DUF364 domain-containing protein [Chloroflexota bacterium]